jgi:hypothetical protein
VNFLSPALLAGLLAAAIPPIIHLIHRRRAVRVRFPALEFIQRSNRKTQRRYRMRQLLLMLTRSLLLGAIAFAVARPYLSRGADPQVAAMDAAGTTVVVVDATYPMQYVLDGESLLDRARLQAGRVLDALGSTGRAALAVAGEKVDVPIGEATGDLTAVRRALGEVQPSAAWGTLPDAVARAYDLLAEQPAEGGRRVVVLTTARGAASDLPRPPPGEGPGAIELIPIDVAEGKPVPNRALLDVTVKAAPEIGANQWRVDAHIANYADEAVDRLPVRLEVNGEPLVRGFVTLEPGQDAHKAFHARFEAKEPVPVSIVLDGDGLAADDRRTLWLHPAPRVRVLAVNGAPHPIPYRDELFYFERALTSGAGAAQVKLTFADLDALDRVGDFKDFDVVVLANVGDLPADRAAALERFVREGGGLFVAVGDKVEPLTFNTRLGALLPRSLRDVRASGDAAASNEAGDRQYAHPDNFDRAHPILEPFPDPERSSLARARIDRYMLLDPAPNAGGRVAVTLDDGAPFLVTHAVGAGRVALLTVPLDRDWGDLPIRPDFVPLVTQVLRFLTRVTAVDTTPVLVGKGAPIPAEDPRVKRVVVEAPSGERFPVERPPAGDAGPWVFGRTGAPGLYKVLPDPPLPDLAALPGFAVAVDPAGADLRGATPKDPAGEPLAQNTAAKLGGERRTELWHAALFALFLLLAAEAALLFKRHRDVRV